MNLARLVDYTLLRPEATAKELEAFCRDARKYGVYGVCVSPVWVKESVRYLKKSNIVVGTVIGFPLGNQTKAAKLVELMQAIENGAREIDAVINIGYIKSGWYNKALDELKKIVKFAHRFNAVVKIIIETAYLSREEIIKATRLVIKSKADFVKTSTGFAPTGARAEDIKLIKKIAGDKIRIKAAGGIRDRKQALTMVRVGADRLGISKIGAILK
ncbi:MAG: deoxyribose-phosphate aldolase [Planctomycetes bacterium]|nr:deoxyribose-phosphate aldolase [Planctomycetota bacterium]